MARTRTMTLKRTYPHCGWSGAQVREFVREVIRDYDAQWDTLLTPRLQTALLAEHALKIIMTAASVAKQVRFEDIAGLRVAMLIEAGLVSPDDENEEPTPSP